MRKFLFSGYAFVVVGCLSIGLRDPGELGIFEASLGGMLIYGVVLLIVGVPLLILDGIVRWAMKQ